MIYKINRFLRWKYKNYLNNRAFIRVKNNKQLLADLDYFARKFYDNENIPKGEGYYKYEDKFLDIWELYKAVRIKKPKEILECGGGGGLSSIVLANAVRDNGFGRVTSMEESEEWFTRTNNAFPGHLKKFIFFYLSPKIEYGYYLFRGAAYKEIPDRAYDFIYIDAPTTALPTGKNGNLEKTFNADFIRLLKESNKIDSIEGMIDNRKTTCYVLNKVTRKVRFDRTRHLGYILPCSKKDLIDDPDKFIYIKNPILNQR